MDIITILLVYTIFFGVGSAMVIVFARHENSNLRKVWLDITFYYCCFTYFFNLKIFNHSKEIVFWATQRELVRSYSLVTQKYL